MAATRSDAGARATPAGLVAGAAPALTRGAARPDAWPPITRRPGVPGVRPAWLAWPVRNFPLSSTIRKKVVVCVECLIGKQKKPILFKVTEPSSIPYRAPSACAKMAAYPDPPPVIPVPESIAAQAAYQLRYKNTEYCSWVSSGPKCFQVLGLSPSLLQNPML